MNPSASRVMLASCLLALATAPAAPAAPAAARDQVDVLLIGDSITEGQGAPPGFRDDLLALLTAEPLHSFRFVGSSGGPPLQGHFMGGKQIEDFYPPDFGHGWGNGKFDTTPDLGPPGTPELAAIHLGTNDLNSQPPPFVPYSFDHGQTLNPSQSAELAEYLEFLLQWQLGPRSFDLRHLVLSLIIPMQNRAQDLKLWNDAVVAMSEDFAEGTVAGTPVRVTLADHYHRFLSNPLLFTFGPGDWMSDALHPNDAGYTQMAEVYRDAIVAAVDDSTAPAAVDDLVATAVDTTRVTLAFSATGDDGLGGQAARYDLRYATGSIDAQSFKLATQVVDEPLAGPPGSPETIEVAGLQPGTTYAFALKVSDDGGNRSELSNVVVATTPGTSTVVLVLREGLDGYFGSTDNVLVDTRSQDNFGSVANVAIGRRGTAEVERSLVRFDLSGIPAGATILDARLRTYNYQRDSSAPAVLGAYRVTKHWVEGTRSTPSPQSGASCWVAAQLAILAWSGPGLGAASDAAVNDDPSFDRYATPEDTTTVAALNTWYEWDLTRAVERWVGGEWHNEGVLLKSIAEASSTTRWFRSSEYATDPALRPELVVTYSNAGSSAIADRDPVAAPAAGRLLAAFPNPFAGSVTIRYELGAPGTVRLRVYDVLGRLRAVLADAGQAPGRHEAIWDGRSADGGRLGAGTYFLRLDGAGIEDTRTVVLAP